MNRRRSRRTGRGAIVGDFGRPAQTTKSAQPHGEVARSRIIQTRASVINSRSLLERETVVDVRIATEDLLSGGGAVEVDGTVGVQNVAAARMPGTDGGVDGRSVVRFGDDVVIRTENTVREEGRRDLGAVGVVVPRGLESLVDGAFVRRFVRAQVRAVVAVGPFGSGRIRGLADAEFADRDVLFSDKELVGSTVGEAGERVARLRAGLEDVVAGQTRAAEGTLLVRVLGSPAGRTGVARANVIVVVAAFALSVSHDDSVVGLRTRGGRPARIAVIFLSRVIVLGKLLNTLEVGCESRCYIFGWYGTH